MQRITSMLAFLALMQFSTAYAGTSNNTLDYFHTQTPGSQPPGLRSQHACLVDGTNNPNSPGGDLTQEKDTDLCPGEELYHVIKGGLGCDNVCRISAWGSETFYVEDGFLKLMAEYSFDAETGKASQPVRAFRDLSTGRKGLPWLPLTVPTSEYVEDNTKVELWVLDDERPVQPFSVTATKDCDVPSRPSCKVVDISVDLAHGSTQIDWLQDRRDDSADPNQDHDVETIVRTVTWQGNVEEFHYGRWFNSQANGGQGAWEGLGLIKWSWDKPDPLVDVGVERHFLVDCAITPPRSTCPDPE